MFLVYCYLLIFFLFTGCNSAASRNTSGPKTYSNGFVDQSNAKKRKWKKQNLLDDDKEFEEELESDETNENTTDTPKLSFSDLKQKIDSMIKSTEIFDLCEIEEKDYFPTFENYLAEEGIELNQVDVDDSALRNYLGFKIDSTSYLNDCEASDTKPRFARHDSTSNETLKESIQDNLIHGELTTSDDSYKYKGNLHYYDKHDNNQIPNDKKLYRVELKTEAFDPILFIIKKDESKVAHVGKDVSETDEKKVVSVEFLADADQPFIVSVETRYERQTGAYTLSISKLQKN